MGFLDMRQWMASLQQQGELKRITAAVDWDREIGAIPRRVLEKKGPALVFENIKGYAGGRCTKLFVSGLGARSRLALALGFPRDASNRELVQHVMMKNRETIAPVTVETVGAFTPAVAADFNGDGKIDLATLVRTLNGGYGVIEVLPGNGNGTFRLESSTPLVGSIANLWQL